MLTTSPQFFKKDPVSKYSHILRYQELDKTSTHVGVGGGRGADAIQPIMVELQALELKLL